MCYVLALIYSLLPVISLIQRELSRSHTIGLYMHFSIYDHTHTWCNSARSFKTPYHWLVHVLLQGHHKCTWKQIHFLTYIQIHFLTYIQMHFVTYTQIHFLTYIQMHFPTVYLLVYFSSGHYINIHIYVYIYMYIYTHTSSQTHCPSMHLPELMFKDILYICTYTQHKCTCKLTVPFCADAWEPKRTRKKPVTYHEAEWYDPSPPLQEGCASRRAMLGYCPGCHVYADICVDFWIAENDARKVVVYTRLQMTSHVLQLASHEAATD